MNNENPICFCSTIRREQKCCCNCANDGQDFSEGTRCGDCLNGAKLPGWTRRERTKEEIKTADREKAQFVNLYADANFPIGRAHMTEKEARECRNKPEPGGKVMRVWHDSQTDETVFETVEVFEKQKPLKTVKMVVDGVTITEFQIEDATIKQIMLGLGNGQTVIHGGF